MKRFKEADRTGDIQHQAHLSSGGRLQLAITHLVTEEPGLSFSDMVHRLGPGNALLQRALRSLVRGKELQYLKRHGTLAYFPPTWMPHDIAAVVALKQSSSRGLLDTILDSPKTAVDSIGAVPLAKPSAYYQLGKLQDAGLIQRRGRGEIVHPTELATWALVYVGGPNLGEV